MSADSERKPLKECTGDDFFKSLEEHVDCVIPATVKKLLTVNSYDNAKALSEFDHTSIEEIESFMRHDFNKDMIEDNETIRDYYGVFSKNQQNFKIVSGQSKIIRSLGDACRKLCGIESSPESVTSEYYMGG